jgi:hypothetical protein
LTAREHRQQFCGLCLSTLMTKGSTDAGISAEQRRNFLTGICGVSLPTLFQRIGTMAVDGQLDQTLRSAQATLCARTSATRRQALDSLAQTCVLSVSTFNSRRGRQVTNPDIATACIGSLGFRTVKCCFIPPESGWAVSSSAKGDSRPTHIAGEGAEGHDRQSAHTRRHLGQQANEPRRVLGPGCRGDPFSALTNVLAAWRRPSFHLLVLDSGGRKRTAMHEGEGHLRAFREAETIGDALSTDGRATLCSQNVGHEQSRHFVRRFNRLEAVFEKCKVRSPGG